MEQKINTTVPDCGLRECVLPIHQDNVSGCKMLDLIQTQEEEARCWEDVFLRVLLLRKHKLKPKRGWKQLLKKKDKKKSRMLKEKAPKKKPK